MKVAELIDLLKVQDLEAQVFVDAEEGGTADSLKVVCYESHPAEVFISTHVDYP